MSKEYDFAASIFYALKIGK